MTREKFMEKLNVELNFLPSDEKENAIRFYEEYFDEAGAENEKDVISELGSPKSIAKKILKETKLQYNDFEHDILKNNNYKYLEESNYKSEINNILNIPAEEKNNETPDENIISGAAKKIKSNAENLYSEILHDGKSKENNGREGEPEKKSDNKKFTKGKPLWLWIVLIVCALPLIISIIGMIFSAFGVAFGVIVSIIAVVFSIFIGSLAVGAGLLICGATFLAVSITNIINGGMIFLPMGLSLVFLSVGIVLTYFSFVLNINVIKWTFTKCLKGLIKAFGSGCSFIYKKFIRR